MKEKKINNRYTIIINLNMLVVEDKINQAHLVRNKEIIKNNQKNLNRMSMVWNIKKISSVVI